MAVDPRKVLDDDKLTIRICDHSDWNEVGYCGLRIRCQCSIPHAYFIPYAYGMCHMRIRVWYNYTRMVQLFAYGILFYTIHVYEDSFWFMHVQ